MTEKRLALVTGASSGIGRAISGAAGPGCRAWCSPAGTMRRCASWRLRARPRQRPCAPLRVTDFAAVDSVLRRLPARRCEIDLYRNNAGHDVGGRTRFDLGTADDWTNVIETNVSSLIRMTRAVVPGMTARGRGDIVNVGSVNALRVVQAMAAYRTSKAAVHAFSDGVARRSRGDADPRNRDPAGAHALGYRRASLPRRRARAEAYCRDFGMALEADDIAAGVLFAINQPPHVTIAQLTILPSNRY